MDDGWKDFARFMDLLGKEEGARSKFGVLRLYEVGCMLADMPAFKEMWGCKGHYGHMPCCLCRNACNHAIQGTPLHLVCAEVVPLTEFDFDRFTKHTDDTIKEVLHRLNEHHTAMMAGDMTKVEFEAREMVLGLGSKTIPYR